MSRNPGSTPPPPDYNERLAEVMRDLASAQEQYARMSDKATTAAQNQKKVVDDLHRQMTALSRSTSDVGTSFRHTTFETTVMATAITHLASQFQQYARGISDTLKTQAQYRMEMDMISQRTGKSIREIDAQRKALEELRSEHNLSRSAIVEWGKAWEMAARGMSGPWQQNLEKFNTVYKRLEATFGPKAARERAEQLAQMQNNRAGVIETLEGGTVAQQYAIAMQLSGQEQTQFVDAANAQSTRTELGAIEKASENIAAMGDRVSETLQTGFEKYLGPAGPQVAEFVAMTAILGTQTSYLLSIAMSTKAMAAEMGIGRGMGGGFLGLGGGGKGSAKPGRAGKMMGRVGKLTGLGGILAGLGGMGLDMVAPDEGPLGAAADIAGGALTGAGFGALAGPWGALLGAAGGAGFGIYKSFFADEPGVSKDPGQIRDALLKEMATSRMQMQKMREFSSIGEQQSLGRAAKGSLAAQVAGGGDVSGLFGQMMGGSQAQATQFSKLYAEKMADVEQRIKNATGNEQKVALQERAMIMEEYATSIDQMLADSGMEQFAQAVRSSMEQRLADVKQTSELAKTEAEMQKGLSGYTEGVLDAYAERKKFLQQTQKESKEAAELLDSQLESRLSQINAAMDQKVKGAGGDENRVAELEVERERRLTAEKRKTLIEKNKLLQDEANAKAEELNDAIESYGKIANKTKELLAYQALEVQGQTFAAESSLLKARGGSVTEIGATAVAGSRMARERADMLAQSEAQDVANIKKQLAADQAGKSAAEQERLAREAAIEIQKRHIQSIEAETQAVEMAIQSMLTPMMEANERLGHSRGLLEIQKGTAEYLGKSFSQIYDIQADIVSLKSQELENTAASMEILRESLKDQGIAARDNADYRKLESQYAQQQADLVKETVGIQRDWMEKALGAAFGVPGGSQFQPFMNDRMLFGSHEVLPGGMRRGGRGMTIPEVTGQMAAAAAGIMPPRAVGIQNGGVGFLDGRGGAVRMRGEMDVNLQVTPDLRTVITDAAKVKIDAENARGGS